MRASLLRWCVAGAALTTTSVAGAQRPAPAGPSPRALPAAATPGEAHAAALAAPTDSNARHLRWWAPLASAVLPGSGQAVAGQTRAAGYLALELYTWLQYREARTDARRARTEYRRIAREAARQPCASACPDGNWDYYELLEKSRYVSSGRFDAAPGGAIDPETADSTYNGYVWGLARELYFGGRPSVEPSDPAYQRALAYYQTRAYGPEYAWSWRDRQQQQGEYRQSVVRWNRANRNATTALSVALANHLFSLVDAYVTLRLQGGGPGQPSELSATLPWSRIPGLARPRR